MASVIGNLNPVVLHHFKLYCIERGTNMSRELNFMLEEFLREQGKMADVPRSTPRSGLKARQAQAPKDDDLSVVDLDALDDDDF